MMVADDFKIKVDIPKDDETYFEIAEQIAKDMPKEDVELYALVPLVNHLKENKELYLKYYLKYKK